MFYLGLETGKEVSHLQDSIACTEVTPVRLKQM
jgi:hypothetical protein